MDVTKRHLETANMAHVYPCFKNLIIAWKIMKWLMHKNAHKTTNLQLNTYVHTVQANKIKTH